MLSYFFLVFFCSTWIFSVKLRHFQKFINKLNTLISKNHNLVQKIIIWYKYLLLFNRVFPELFGRNFNSQFFRYRSWFEAFLYLLVGDGGEAPLKV